LSQRRFFFLCLLAVPAFLLCLNLVLTQPGNQRNGLEIISIIICIPIIFFNIWEFQQPETLDSVLRADFLKSSPIVLSYAAGRFLVIGIGSLTFLTLIFLISNPGNRATQTTTISALQKTIDISNIQTSAVQTALFDLGLITPDETTPQPTQFTAPTEEFQTPSDAQPTPFVEPTQETPYPLNPEPNTPVPDTITPSPTNRPVDSTPEPTPTDTIAPSPTSRPVDSTPEPTATSTFTPSPTNRPVDGTPILLIGSGNNEVFFNKWIGPAVLIASHEGDEDFIVSNYSASNQKIGTLVDTVGLYVGSLPLDFLETEYTTRFNIIANGDWELQIIPLGLAREEPISTSIDGDGDDVINLLGGTPDQISINASQTTGNFKLWAYSQGNKIALVNTTAPYSGTVAAPAGTTTIVVNTLGIWYISISAK